MSKYELPMVLKGKCSPKDYDHWLKAKVQAHVRRDRNRGNENASVASYMDTIHQAVCDGGDRDAYTGEALDWSLIRTYDNQESKKGGREYKKRFAALPTVDHVDDGMGAPNFRICSWRTNDCKHDLSIDELLTFAKTFLSHQTGTLTHRTACRLIPVRGDILDVAPSKSDACVLWLRSGFNQYDLTWRSICDHWSGMGDLKCPWDASNGLLVETNLRSLRHVYFLPNHGNTKGYSSESALVNAIHGALDKLTELQCSRISFIHVPLADRDRDLDAAKMLVRSLKGWDYIYPGKIDEVYLVDRDGGFDQLCNGMAGG